MSLNLSRSPQTSSQLRPTAERLGFKSQMSSPHTPDPRPPPEPGVTPLFASSRRVSPPCPRLHARGLRSLRLVARIAAFQAAEDGSKPSGSASVPEPKEAPRGRTNFGIGTPVPLRLTAGCRTLNAVIVVRIHEGEPFIHNHAGVAQRSRAALSYGEGRLFKSAHRHQPSPLRGFGWQATQWRRLPAEASAKVGCKISLR